MDSAPEKLTPEEHRQEIEAILAEYQHQKMLESLVGPLVSMVVHVTVVVFLVFFISLDQPSAAPEVSFTMKPAEEVKEADKPEPPEPPPDLEVPLIDMQAPTNNAPATSMTNFGDVGGASFTIPSSGSPYKVRVPAGGGAGFGMGTAGLGGGRGSSGNAFAGRFYDVRQTMNGAWLDGPTASSGARVANYKKILDAYVKYLCSGGATSNPLVDLNVYTAVRDGQPVVLYTNGFFMPNCDANLGPQCYGCGDLAKKPPSWLAHYRAKMRVGKDITFRFVGKGDDYLVVLINRQVVLIAPWDIDNAATTSKDPFIRPPIMWQPSESISNMATTYDTFIGQGHYAMMLHGTWLSFKKNDIVEMDVILGEGAGGCFGACLFVEERGARYKVVEGAAAGRSASDFATRRPVLPLFSTVEILDDRVPDNIRGAYQADRLDIKGGLLGMTTMEMFQERLGSIAVKTE